MDFDSSDLAGWANGNPVAGAPAPAATADAVEEHDEAPAEEGIGGCLHALLADLQKHRESLGGQDVSEEDKKVKKLLSNTIADLDDMIENVQEAADSYDDAHADDEDEEEKEIERADGGKE